MEPELVALMPHTVTVEAYASQDRYGKPAYGAAASYKAMVEQKVRQVRNLAGEEAVSTTTVYLDAVAAITPRDRVTLPAAFSPRTPPIINVSRFSDENGLHHTELYL